MAEKNFYIIAGCNGAGKTTAASKIFPEILESYEFVNADEIARKLKKIDPECSDIKAGRVMLERIDELISMGKNFTIETTLASKSLKNLIMKAREAGYHTRLAFFWLSSPALALARVRSRIEHGGHGIPGDVITRRYYSGLNNLFNIYAPLCTRWAILDNSRFSIEYIIRGYGDNLIEIENYGIFVKIINQFSNG